MDSSLLDTAFKSGFAFVQIALLFGGFICLLLGGLMIYSNFHSNSGDYRVRGRVTGFRSGSGKLGDTAGAGSMFYPVYEYTDRHGQAIQAESNSGSSAMNPKLIGTTVVIQVNPATPHRASTSMPIFFIIGAMLLLMGSALFYSAFSFYPVNGYTWGIGAIGLLHLGYKIRRLIKPKEQRETKDEFRTRIDKEFLETRQAMPLVGRTEATALLRKRDLIAQRAAPFVFLIAIGILGAGFYFTKDIALMTATGSRASGELVRYEAQRDSEGVTTYKPYVRYLDSAQTIHVFGDKFSFSIRPYAAGDPVPVLYLEGQDKAMIDRGLWNWALPAGFWIFGLLCLLGALSSWSKTRRI